MPIYYTLEPPQGTRAIHRDKDKVYNGVLDVLHHTKDLQLINNAIIRREYKTEVRKGKGEGKMRTYSLKQKMGKTVQSAFRD